MSQKHHPGSESVPHKHAVKDKRTIVNASHIFCKPHRSSRPEHIVVILRGLPGSIHRSLFNIILTRSKIHDHVYHYFYLGSGKSYLAKALRDLEVDNGGTAPRIHCIDDYFMSEVETVSSAVDECLIHVIWHSAVMILSFLVNIMPLKVEDNDVPKSAGSVNGKEQVHMKLEYCYEPEMEEV